MYPLGVAAVITKLGVVWTQHMENIVHAHAVNIRPSLFPRSKALGRG